MYYSEDVLRQVREANDIVDVISEHVSLTRRGSNYVGLCPFHNEKTGSFSVNQRDQFFHCFGCHAGGNVITFLMKLDNLSFQEAVQELADRAHIELPKQELTEEEKRRIARKERFREINRETALFYHNQLAKGENGALARGYLRKRQIADEYAVRFGLGYSPLQRDSLYNYLKSKGYSFDEMVGAGVLMGTETQHYDRFFNRLMFPIMDVSGHVIAFGGRVLGDGEPKYLNSNENEIFSKRKNLYMMNLAKLSKKGYALVVEGYMDVLSLHQAGMDNAVASLGTALTPEQCLLLKRFFNDVVLVYDSDAAGTAAARRALPILENAGLSAKVAQVPSGKDPDEFIKTEGVEAFEEMIRTKAMDPIEFEEMILDKQAGGDGTDAKVKKIKALEERIAQTPDNIERTLRIQELARKYRLREEDVTADVEKIRRNAGRVLQVDLSKRVQLDENIDKSHELSLLAVLLRRPELFETIAAHVGPGDFSAGSDFCKQLAATVWEKLGQGDKPLAADFISLFPDADAQCLVVEMFTKDPTLGDENFDYSKYVTELVKGVLSNSYKLSQNQEMSIEEMQNYINKTKELKNLWIKII